MITITTIPPAAASATTTSVAVRLTGKTMPYYRESAISSTLAVSVDSSELVGTTVIARVRVTANVTYQPVNRCGRRSEVIDDVFTVAFAATGTNTVSVTQPTAIVTDPAFDRCCVAHGVTVSGVTAISIA